MRVVRVMIVMRGSDARTRGCCSLPLLCRLLCSLLCTVLSSSLLSRSKNFATGNLWNLWWKGGQCDLNQVQWIKSVIWNSGMRIYCLLLTVHNSPVNSSTAQCLKRWDQWTSGRWLYQSIVHCVMVWIGWCLLLYITCNNMIAWCVQKNHKTTWNTISSTVG